MQYLVRFILLPFLAAAATGGVRATEDGTTVLPPAEYKRADSNFYPKGDIMRTHPTAVIIAAGSMTQKGDSYFFTPHKKAPKEIYFETVNDWIEPITPPDMPASLGVAPDAMQIREPQGDVQVALPSAPANFSPVTDGMALPNGAVVKTGANGTAAVLFGGVDSARLMPNSAAAVQQTVTAQSRTAEVDLTAGGVFSKVGTQVGVKGTYEVHTPFGNAVAHGTDFVTIVMPTRTDVWVAQGAVSLEEPNSKKAETVTSDGTGPLKLMRFPGIADPDQSVQADVETLTMALNFSPLANQKIKALRDKKAGGATLTANEEAYLKRLKEVPCLFKLALVEPPAPPPPAPAPLAATPPPAPPVMPPPAKAKLHPKSVVVLPNGMVRYHGATTDLAAFQSKLTPIGKTTPDQPFTIRAGSDVPPGQVQAVLDTFHAANLQNVTTEVHVVPTPAVAATPTAPSPAPTPTPSPAPEVPAPHLAISAPSPQPLFPIAIDLRSDGKVDLAGETITLDELKPKLDAIAKSTPNQPLVISGREKVTHDQLKKVVAICHEAKLKPKIAKAAPVVAAPAAPPAPTAATTPVPATPAAPVPATPATPATETSTPPAAAPATTPAPPTVAAKPPANKGPLHVTVRASGKVRLKGATLSVAEFQAKLTEVIKVNPAQAVVIRAEKKVTDVQLKAVVDACTAAQAKDVTVATPPPAPATPPASTATTKPVATKPAAPNLPTPSLIMHPVMKPAAAAPPEEAVPSTPSY